MRKFSKTLLSLLLVVLMLTGGFPFANFITKVEAAGGETYQYVKASSISAGKTYLIGTSDGKVLGVQDGTIENGTLITTDRTVSSNTIAEWNGAENYEWSVIPGRAQGTHLGATYMFQNKKTGAYLYNPVYEDGGSSSAQAMKVTYDPLHDTYSPYSRQVFNSTQAAQSYFKGIGGTCATYNFGVAWNGGAWTTIQRTAGNGDAYAEFKMDSSTTYWFISSVFHIPSPTATANQYRKFELFQFSNAASNGFYNSNLTGGYNVWRGVTNGGSAQTFSSYRFDIEQNTDQLYLSSTFAANSAHAITALYQYRLVEAWFGAGGYYPSQRFPFTQFCVSINSSKNATIGNFATSITTNANNGSHYTEMYFYGWQSGQFKRIWNSTALNNTTCFYEKQPVGNAPTVTWQAITSNSELVSGEEYIICSRKTTGSAAAWCCLTNDSDYVHPSVSITAPGIVNSGITDNDIFILRRIKKVAPGVNGSGTDAGDYFLLQNKATGKLFATSQLNDAGCGLHDQATDGGGIPYGTRYMWTYDVSSQNLTGYHTAQNANESSPTGKVIGFSNGALAINNTCFFYKRVTCSHPNATSTVTKAANCVETGTRTYSCGTCGSSWTETIPVDSSNHKGPIVDTAAVAATCSAVGYTAGKQCSACHVYTQGHTQIGIDSNAHNWGGWTKISDTQHQRTCTINSSHKETANHSWDAGVVTTQPTCTREGVRTYTCSVCSGTKTETIAKLAHTPGDWETTQQPTCTATGTKVKKCTVCGTVLESETLAALGHQWGNWESYGNADNHRRVCGRDNSHVETQAHDWVLQSGGTVATCTQVGSASYKCSVCNQTKSVSGSLDPSNHDGHLTHTAAVAATCVAAGNIEYWYCTACHKYFSNAAGTTEITQASTVIAIDANAHDWGDWTDAGAAGHTRVCSRSASHTETVAHTYPSTWNQGNDTHHTKTCTVGTCAHVLSEEHTFGDWVVVTPAQVGVAGLKRHTCTVCGKVVDATIPALTNPQMTVGTVNTTQGSTVNVDVTLTGNVGIYAQNFVIYYPKELTLNSITSCGDVYPTTEGQTSNPLFMDPVTNARMEGYFDYANITKAGNYGAAYYVDNGALENSTNDGRIITLSFTVPSGSSTTDYPVGIFGVYAPTDDAIDANGDSLAMSVVYHNGNIHITDPNTECTTHTWGAWVDVTPATCTSAGEQRRVCQVCGAVEYQYVAKGEHNYVDTVTAPTCTEQGYTTHVCSICGDSYVDTYVSALGHDLGGWTTVRSATGLSAEIQRRYCSRCDYYEEQSGGHAAYGTGYSQTGDSQTVRYELTDTVLAGHEYIIANSDATGAAKALYDNNGEKGSGSVTVRDDNGTKYITTASDTYVWNTLSGVYFENKGTGNFLRAFNGTSGDNISLNLGITADSANTNEYKFNSNGFQSAGGYYLGYKDSITAVPTGVDPDDYAHPSGNKQNITGYAFTGGTDAETSGDYTMTVDVCFASAGSYATFSRWNGSALDSYTFRPTTATIKIGNVTQNAEFSYGSSSYGNHWIRFQVVAEGGKLNMYVDGVKVINNVTISTPGYAAGIITFGDGEGTVYIDNLVIESATHDVGYSFDGNRFGDGDDRSSVASGWTNNQPTATTVATDVFTASTDSSDRVYFYEKRTVGDAIEIYERASAVESGKAYVLVNRNLEGNGTILTGASTANITVDSDGVSYTPYVQTLASNEFVAMAKGNSFIFNNTGAAKFLTVNGAETTLSDDCYLTVTNAATGASVNVAGSVYYLYEKTPVEYIDTDVVDDFAIIDYGTGFTNVPIRTNDNWTGTIPGTVTVQGIASTLPSGVNTNNYFYKQEKATYTSSVAVASGTVSYANGAISYTKNALKRIEGIETVYYGCTIDKIGAHMYAKVNIIPATTVYYEDTPSNTEYIEYTNGTYPAGNGAAWTDVGTDNTIGYLFDNIYSDNETYGYNSANNNSSFIQYSAGTAKKVRVADSNVDKSYANSTWMPSLTLTFKGTGFEVLAATGSSSAVIFYTVERDGATVEQTFTDNYFGYSWTGSEWVASSAGDVALYQVPVINKDYGVYGTYTVTIMVSYDHWTDVAGLRYADFYFDGFRVYNPIDTSAAANLEAVNRYKADSEFDPKFVDLHASIVNDQTAHGSLFVDGNGMTRNVDVVTEYTDIGARDEVMLQHGFGISFSLESASIPGKIALGAKVAQGSAGTLRVVITNGETIDIPISSGTNMYFNLSDYISWTGSEGNYTSTEITVTNMSQSGIISLTDLKVTSGAGATTPNVGFAAANERDAWEALAEVYGVEVIAGDVNGDGKVNSRDLALLKRYLAGDAELSKYDREAADFDENSKINSRDLRSLKDLLGN